MDPNLQRRPMARVPGAAPRRSPAPLVLLAALVLAACGGDGEPPEDTAGADTAAPAAGQAAQGEDAAGMDTATVRVADAGLSTPESVLYDEEADVYLVSNINGAPTETDGNGFISRVAPDGTVESLRWIDGAAEGITLNAPKGMALRGDTLFVTDIDSVRAFDRSTGEAYGARGVPGATFLNDLTVGDDGTLYVSDSGLNADFSSSGTDAIYRFRGDSAVAVAEGAELGSPNGIVAFGDYMVVVGFGGPEVRVLGVGEGEANPQIIAMLPGGQLDGVVRRADGSLLVSSWETQSVYRVPGLGQSGEPSVVIEGVPSPADIGWDPRRRRVLIPVFQENRLEFRPIGPPR